MPLVTRRHAAEPAAAEILSIGRNYTIAPMPNPDVLMKYTERYEHILNKFPQGALFGRFDSATAARK